MFTYSVILVTTRVQRILVNNMVEGCLYISHEKSFDPCGKWYYVTWRNAHAQYKKHEFYRRKRDFLQNKMKFYCKNMNFIDKKKEFYTKQMKFYRQVKTSRSEWLLRFCILNEP